MRTCTSAAPASNSIATSWRVVLPRTIESSTTTSRLPVDLGERVELHPDALLAQPLVRLDERAADVAVLDQALAVRDPGRAREADRGRRARVGDRHHEVGLGRRLGREPLAHAHAHAVHLGARERRVGPREVDVLEDAERLPAFGQRLRRVQPVLVDQDELAGPHVALVARRRSGRTRRSRRRAPSRRRGGRARAAGCRAGRGSRRASLRRARRPSTRPRAAPSRARPPPRAARGRGRSARRSPRCRRSRRARSRPPRARPAARSCSSGCRCGRARPCGRGRGGRAAARSPRASSRSSSSACGRSRRRPGAPAGSPRRRPARRGPCRGARSGGRGRRRRSRPTPGRGAGARSGRSR